MKKRIFFLLSFPLVCFSQSLTIYNPQDLYNSPGGIYDIDSLRSLYIDFYNPNYHQILDSTYYDDPGFRLPASITLGATSLDSVGIRYKGGSTYTKSTTATKKPLNIDINEHISGQKLMDYKKVKLSNAWYDPTFMKELMAARIYQQYLPAEEVNLMKVYTQGSYLGLYVNTEAINKQFLEKHFNEKDGVLFKCDPDLSASKPLDPNLQYLGADSSFYFSGYELKSDLGWNELVELTFALNKNPSSLGDFLNIDRVLWYFAVNKAILNQDTYNMGLLHNYYLYQTEDGLFQIIPWDLSESFVGAFWKNNQIFQDDPFYDNKLDQKDYPLLYTLLDDTLYRKIYAAHLRKIASESLDTSWFSSEISRLQSMAFDAASNDQEKGFSNTDFYDNVYQPVVLNSVTTAAPIIPVVFGRKDYLLNHPELSLTPPVIDSVDISSGNIMAKITNGNTVELMATISAYNSKFQSFSMKDDGMNGDAVSGDGIFTTSIPFQPTSQDIKFYIRAQNNDALALSPEKAEYEFYVYSTTTGIFDSKDPSEQINIYPNPAKSRIHIQFETAQAVDYKLMVPTGMVVLSGSIGSGHSEINLSHLPKGIYILIAGSSSYKILKTN